MKQIIILVVFFLTILNISAQYDPESGANLTSGDVQHFIKHYPELVKEFKNFDVKFDDKRQTYDFSDALLQNQELQKILAKHGYNDANEFALKTAAIALSYAAIRFKEEYSAHSPEIQQAIREIENNPDLTPDQKEQIKEQLLSTVSNMEDKQKQIASEEDIEVVRPFVDQLTNVFEAEE